MDKEFLIDYEQRERQEIEKFYKKVREGKFKPDERYPPDNRFHKLKEPVAVTSKGTSIWPQIPLCGSLVIPLSPVPGRKFDELHGFSAKDIGKLIDFARESGKIQFALDTTSPLSYEGLDFLEPIFMELQPPSVAAIPWMLYEKRAKKFAATFLTLATIPNVKLGCNFSDLIQKPYLMSNFPVKFTVDVINKRCTDYVLLKTLGHEEIVKKLEDLMIDDPYKALPMFAVLSSLVSYPLLSPLRATQNFSRWFFFESSQILRGRGFTLNEAKFSGIKLSYDIGKFLMEKLTYMPQSLDACKDVISRYKQEDLYNVMMALNDGVERDKPGLVYNKKIELSTILDNLWKDKKLQSRVSSLKFGIPVSMAVVGSIAGGPIGGGAGLLAGLGFNAADRIVGIKTDLLSERIAKYIVPNHLVAIYDFKKKYNLKT